ncbi:conserved hypothetical protein [Vibrio nigripulchritudo MADA3029]|uniref:DUF4123 domain-containing protein n=1 Tax=Vibrio nigripulchritudo TaxID=28173 RepID=UPI0003B21D91|nr:DUF4123 domain-containing protein [Vibrio nigripulchritudo]CCN50834.1 conserved hypothetical protein [Vibrio nigripulchritudo MADA3020]CCN56692.1 conserved hypothetical protein [Vibrio nigripulchritudo MADA3021]CCN62549.1 conserved hypothetical protein [Vibrio nigripulchritudo MADA3029]
MMPEFSNDDIETEGVSLFDVMSNTTGTLYKLVDKQLFPKLDELQNAFSGRHDARTIPLYRDTKYHQLLEFSPLLIEIENGNLGETLFH